MATILESNIGDVKYHLDNLNFDGPLDLLLSLLAKEKLDIKDLFVSDITTQYLEIVASMEKLDYEYCADFLLLASELIRIKSKALLPVLEFDDEPIDTITDEARMQFNVELFKICKEQAEKLENMEILHRFYRDPEYSEKDFKVIYQQFNLDKLIEVFSALIQRIEFTEKPEEPKLIIRERFTVGEKVEYISELIKERKVIRFFDLYEADYTKIEVINTFLAVLEILKLRRATGEQSEKFSDIILKFNPEGYADTKGEVASVDEYN